MRYTKEIDFDAESGWSDPSGKSLDPQVSGLLDEITGIGPDGPCTYGELSVDYDVIVSERDSAGYVDREVVVHGADVTLAVRNGTERTSASPGEAQILAEVLESELVDRAIGHETSRRCWNKSRVSRKVGEL